MNTGVLKMQEQISPGFFERFQKTYTYYFFNCLLVMTRLVLLGMASMALDW